MSKTAIGHIVVTLEDLAAEHPDQMEQRAKYQFQIMDGSTVISTGKGDLSQLLPPEQWEILKQVLSDMRLALTSELAS